MNNREYSYTYITTTATTGSTATIFTGRGVLHAITKTNASGGAKDIIRICDTASTTSTTANVGLIAVGVAPGTFNFDAVISAGLKVDVGNAADLTVTWMKG